MSIRSKAAPRPGRPKGATSFDEEVAKAFGNVLRARRIATGMSQEFLALTTGMERSYLSRLERGLSLPTLLVLLKIASGLDCEFSDLVGPVEKAFRRNREAKPRRQ